MGRSTLHGVTDGEWSVFAEKVVAERDAALDRIRELEAENLHLRIHRSKLDCRYAGRVADTSGAHCPIDDPCLRCRAEAAEALAATQRELLNEFEDKLNRQEAKLAAVGELPGKWRSCATNTYLKGQGYMTPSDCADELAAKLKKESGDDRVED